jgi:hypothetical protein
MKNITLLFFILFSFAFAKNAVSAVPIQVKKEIIPFVKDTIELNSIEEQRAEILSIIEMTKKTMNWTFFTIILFLATLVYLLVDGAILLSLLMFILNLFLNVIILSNMSKIDKILSFYPSLQKDKKIEKTFFKSNIKAIVILCFYLLSGLLGLFLINLVDLFFSRNLVVPIMALTFLLMFFLADATFFKAKP